MAVTVTVPLSPVPTAPPGAWSLGARSLWHEYTRASDEMFAAADTDFAPWYVVRSDDKRRARLDCISHLLAGVPYKDVWSNCRTGRGPRSTRRPIIRSNSRQSGIEPRAWRYGRQNR